MDIKNIQKIGVGRNVASIDIGSHTARILIARCTDSVDLFQPFFRKEEYTSLGNYFVDNAKRSIRMEAIERTLKVLEGFALYTANHEVETPWAVSTGIFRKADNTDYFLGLIKERTGFDVEIISGEKEAILTRTGILHFLDFGERSSVLFDLGGATTEFITGFDNKMSIKSVPLGALVLTRRFFRQDPPKERSINELTIYVDAVLRETFPQAGNSGEDSIIIGAGGTATTLAAMIYRIDVEDITSDRINGLIIESSRVEDLYSKMIKMTVEDRFTLIGLDKGRADVILAGTLIIMRILYYFRFRSMVVSYSDILEGIIIEHLKGEKYEQRKY